MDLPRKPRPRDRIEIAIPGKRPHPAIVLRVNEAQSFMVVATGTSAGSPDDEAPILVVDKQPLLSQLQLNAAKTTMFFPAFIHVMQWNGNVYEVRGKCPPGAFDKLMRGLDAVVAEVRAGRRKLSTIPVVAPALNEVFLADADGAEPR